MARIINSPGVQITEIDKSLNVGLNVGTNIFVCGFSPQGPTNELIYISNKDELDQIFFGANGPTNDSEKYFYYTCKEILNSPANLLVTRLPYGENEGEGYDGLYTALFFPMSARTTNSFFIYTPILCTLNESDIFNLRNNSFSWPNAIREGQLMECGFVIINKGRTTINEDYEGFYIGMCDTFILTALSSNTYNVISAVSAITTSANNFFRSVPTSYIGFKLTGNEFDDSISKIIMTAPSFDINDDKYRSSIIVYLFKLSNNFFESTNKLYALPYEYFIGSFVPQDVEFDPIKGKKSFYIQDIINENSNYLELYVNKNISNQEWFVNNRRKEVYARVPALFSIGSYSKKYNNNKILGEIPKKLERALFLAENRELIDIDIVVEGGLGTQWAYCKTLGINSYDDESNLGNHYFNLSSANSDLINNYKTIFNIFESFVSDIRKDCIFYADPLRCIFVLGKDNKVNSNRRYNFTSHVFIPLRNLYSSVNSNYVATYANWVKIYDYISGKFMWVPFSGWQAAITARLDANHYPWFAPAGLNNGIIRNIIDIAINPSQKQRDLLYKIGINPIVFFPQDGFVVWGQKTLQAKPSAFDRINVRRLFLALEKATLRLARYFVMEPNTVYTRTRFVNTLRPIFELAKNTEGIYDYQIVCDERNNTPEVIDQNELRADIYIKPVRTAEYILINFIATRTGQDFNELIM